MVDIYKSVKFLLVFWDYLKQLRMGIIKRGCFSKMDKSFFGETDLFKEFLLRNDGFKKQTPWRERERERSGGK